jgi:hypothetical protein
MTLSERAMIKIAVDLGSLAGDVAPAIINSTIDLLPAGILKAATHVDLLTRDGSISFRDRDRILLGLCGGSHVKMSHVEADIAKARDSLVEKQAYAFQASEEFTEYLLS